MNSYVRTAALSLFLFLMFLDNFRAWNVYGSQLFLSRYLFDPIRFEQFGWGMYSFNFTQVKALRYRYHLADGNTIEQDSPYAHIPSFKRTLLGNFDMEVMGDNSGVLPNHLAKYLCKHPPSLPGALSSVTLLTVLRRVPRLFEVNQQDGQIVDVQEGVTAECQ